MLSRIKYIRGWEPGGAGLSLRALPLFISEGGAGSRKAALCQRVGISGGARPIPVDVADAGHIQELGGQRDWRSRGRETEIV